MSATRLPAGWIDSGLVERQYPAPELMKEIEDYGPPESMPSGTTRQLRPATRPARDPTAVGPDGSAAPASLPDKVAGLIRVAFGGPGSFRPRRPHHLDDRAEAEHDECHPEAEDEG